MKCLQCGQDNPPDATYCASCGAKMEGQPAVSFSPGVFSSYGNAWRRMWKTFLILLAMVVIAFIISLPSSIRQVYSQETFDAMVGLLSAIGFIYVVFIVNPVDYGRKYAFLKVARREKTEIKDMFKAFNNYWHAVGANLLVLIITIIGLCFLIIPGIVFACKFAFVPYLIVDRKMAIIEAIKESWRMTGGYSWKIFLLNLLGIPIVIAGAICLGVGVIIAGMWIDLANASLYHAVSLERPPRTERTAAAVA